MAEEASAGSPLARVRRGLARFLEARVDRHSAVGLRLTLGVVVCAVAVWVFSGLLEAVLDNDSLVRWDEMANGWFHQHATRAGLAVFNAITLLGSVGAWTVVVLVAAWLWHKNHHLLLTAWLGTNIGGLLLQLTLKSFIHRSRPQYAAAYLFGHSYSFPSGHTMQSTITYFMLVVVGVKAEQGWREHRRVLYGVAAALVLLIGVSRLYLGVHYPSDVVSGFAAGIAWLAASITLLRLFDDRNRALARALDVPSLT